VARLEARGTATGRSADWEESARVIGAGVAAGIVKRAPDGPGAYLLGSVGGGLDPRESDRVVTLGGSAGTHFGAGRHLFAELRFERWLQRGVRHHDLPPYVITALLGLAVP
jgi:hypothetical protein